MLLYNNFLGGKLVEVFYKRAAQPFSFVILSIIFICAFTIIPVLYNYNSSLSNNKKSMFLITSYKKCFPSSLHNITSCYNKSSSLMKII